MNKRPWVYYFHLSVPSVSSLDASEVIIEHDSVTDTLYANLWQLDGPTINCVVSRYQYVRIELGSRRPVGTMVEAFTSRAVQQQPRFLELAAFCRDLFRPLRSARDMLSQSLMLKVVHHEVVLATNAYDRLHGIRSSRSRKQDWIESNRHQPTDEVSYPISALPHEPALQPQPQEDWVIAEFSHALALIGDQPLPERDAAFDRLLHYWDDQPSDPIKRATGHLLLDFIGQNPLNHQLTRELRVHSEEILLRALKAG
jgi:hypothetical protein